jgi:fucose 4-O-acetylase-like acetyltransferase
VEGRVNQIDIAKGISITLVAMHHSQLKVLIPEFIDPLGLFRMPLFFFLSGIFFTWGVGAKDFIYKKFESLLKPYFVVLFSILLINLLMGYGGLADKLLGIFFGNGATLDWKWAPLWFLPHLFAVYCFTYILFKYCHFSKLKSLSFTIIIAMFFIFGSMLISLFWSREADIDSTTFLGLPFSLDIILLTSAFFILGQHLRENIVNFQLNIPVAILSLVTFLSVLTFTEAKINLNQRVYNDVFFSTLGAASGIYLTLTLSFLIAKNEILSFVPKYLGAASLYILIFHSFLSRKIFSYLSEGNYNDSTVLYIAFLSFILSVLIPLLIKKVIENSDILSLGFSPLRSNKLIQKWRKAKE